MTTLLQASRASNSDLDEPLVYCVLVNWNGWWDTIACLRSLEAQDHRNLQVIVVDNASTNHSVERIREAFPGIEIINADANRGFSAGCNLGIRRAFDNKASFVWLLNNDTVAPPNTLTRLLAASGGDIGITGTVLYYMDDPSQIQAWGGGKILRWMGYVTQFDKPAPLGPDSFLTFASVLIRTEVFAQIGLLDEQYFMYFDDSDFCFRARKAGWKLTIATDTAVLHKEGASRKRDNSPRMERVATASGLRFLQLHASAPLVAIALFVSSRLAKRIVRGNIPGLRAVILGVSDWWHGRSMASPGGLS